MNRFILVTLFLFSTSFLFATHNRSGEITYIQTDDLTIEATITTFTKTSSIPADRDSLTICWGDESCEIVYRSNGPNNNGEDLGNDFKRNKYIISHSYADFGDYIISMTDPNRNMSVLNVNNGLSDNIPFHLETEFTLTEEANSSPIILQEPIDIAYLGQPYLHALSAFDVEGDSVAYRLVTPLMATGVFVTDYAEVSEIGAGDENVLSFDETIGLLDWSTPQVEGEYNIAFEILTYRDGVLNGRIVRDMQILVLEMPNLLCDIDTNFGGNEDVINVSVGDIVNMEITAMDMDVEQILTLSSTSGLYDFFSFPASFDVINQNENIVNAVFNWEVKQEHIREHPYQIVFKAKDEFGLANYAVRQFRVLGFLDDTDDPNIADNFTIYPNPATDKLVIKAESEELSGGKYSIWNANGRKIKNGIFSNTTEHYIDIVTLPAGIYFVRIEGEVIGKFVRIKI